MEPRLKTSTQWSPFPAELCEQCDQVLTERFAEDYELADSEFVTEGRIYKGEVLGRFGLKLKDQLKQPNFELSVEYQDENANVLELIQNSMDVVEHLWEELLEEDLDDENLSRQWQTMNFEGKNYHYRYSTVNTSLEEEADKLLEEFEKKLVYGEAQLEDEIIEEGENTLH